MPSPHKPQWTDAELAARVAFQLTPALRQLCPSFERAMDNSAIAAALRAHGKAWQRRHPKGER